MRKSSNRADTEVRLPTEQDFDPSGGCLDAQSAWRNFGELSIPEALSVLRENPIHYLENFMFMGSRAFVFYFPVLDTFLREFRLAEHEGESKAAYTGSCVAMQFRLNNAIHLIPILPAIRSLADYVCLNAHLLTTHTDEQRRIVRDWQAVYKAIDSAAS
ncbi:MAG: hypothetical protein V4727_02925 [Verrucomicrobiota bacterium]